MNARLEHVALWVRDVDLVAGFYARYFDARVGDRYENPRKGFQSRFLAFASGARLEVMARTDVGTRGTGEAWDLRTWPSRSATKPPWMRWRHASGGRRAVLDGPRRTGDGYYECVVLDPGGQSRRGHGGMKMKLLAVLACAGRGPRRARACRVARSHANREALDALVVAGQRGGTRAPRRAVARVRRRRASAAWRSRLSMARAARESATRFPLAAMDRDAGLHRAEVARLGLGVDMATGTGWPFGGPWVSSVQGSSTPALVDARLTGKPTAMKVKRAAPGGEGLVLDPYSTSALDQYLAKFTPALRALPAGTLRGQFHDSFEYYNAGWSPTLPQEFARLNGYDIQNYARELTGEKPLDADRLGRLKGDYRRTLAKMHLDYVNAWTRWAHAQGFAARNQAHGAPGNLLDLYAAADIPETESYGMTPLPIAGLRAAPDDVNPDPDPAQNLIARFASSAAHVAGRPLASSETLTWLRENFREAPWAAKPQLDRLFAAGINHVFYHGASYSRADAEWPGWFFYASSQLNPNNPLWRDYAAMNRYVARVQSLLQAGRPDNDVLLYWSFDDIADDADGLMRQLGVHENRWLTESATARVALQLMNAGYSFDFISEAQLAQLRVVDGVLVAPGGRYRALVIPRVRRMSPATLATSRDCKRRCCSRRLPEDVPGLGDLDARRAQFNA
jgi:catechol 2,3-dioxygenase-like lactoylglutathione lyase family enzyme